MYQPLSISFPRYILRTGMLTQAFSFSSDYLTSIKSLNDKSEKRELVVSLRSCPSHGRSLDRRIGGFACLM